MSLSISLEGTASYVPETIVGRDFFVDAGADRMASMFKGGRTRHHVSPGETAAKMMERAATKLANRLNLDLSRDVDLILTNVTCLDMPFTGCGATVSHRLGTRPKLILDVHNAGCVSFVYMMEIARSLMEGHGAKSALICNVQNAGGRVFSHPLNRQRPQSAIPGDGCGVGYIVAGSDNPVLSIKTASYGEYAEDMRIVSDDGNPWWSPRETPVHVDFTPEKITKIVARGNQLVPEMVRAACDEAGVRTEDIDLLVTNQPNPIFLRNWREALLLDEEQHVHTFDEHGNLFGAAIPIALERAEESRQLKDNSLVALGGFSHAGDYAAAAIVNWRAAA